MIKVRILFSYLFFIVGALSYQHVFAMVVTEPLRIIYSAGEGDKIINISSTDDVATAVHVSLLGEDENNTSLAILPVSVSPSDFTLDAKSTKQITLLPNKQVKMNQDKEQFFYLNITQYPIQNEVIDGTSDKEIDVSYRINQRIKIYYRPAKLTNHSDSAGNELLFKFVKKNREQSFIEVTNPTPYFIFINSIKMLQRREPNKNLLADNNRFESAPLSKKTIVLDSSLNLKSSLLIEYSNEFGVRFVREVGLNGK